MQHYHANPGGAKAQILHEMFGVSGEAQASFGHTLLAVLVQMCDIFSLAKSMLLNITLLLILLLIFFLSLHDHHQSRKNIRMVFEGKHCYISYDHLIYITITVLIG